MQQVDAEVEEILQVTYNWFREYGGEWPNFDYIERWLSRFRALDVAQIVVSIPDAQLKSLMIVDGRPDPSRKMVLSVEGVSHCRGSDDDIHNFVGALKLMVQRDTNYDPPPDRTEWLISITAEELAEKLKLPLKSDSNSIGRLMALLRAEGLVLGGNHSDDGSSPALFISSDVRRFRTVESFTDYVTIRSQLRRSAIGDNNYGWRPKVTSWWSKSDKLTVIMAPSGIVVAILAITAFVIAH